MVEGSGSRSFDRNLLFSNGMDKCSHISRELDKQSGQICAISQLVRYWATIGRIPGDGARRAAVLAAADADLMTVHNGPCQHGPHV